MKGCLIFLACLIIISCGHHDKKKWRDADQYQLSRYSLNKDAIPASQLHPDKIRDAIPKVESRTRAGNTSPYSVFGKTYKVMPSAKGYKATGQASWYGMKFHGHNTANGEKYDVNQMTAAHKTLPIPTYVKVTNLSNKRTCIVRVNDRGPFKGDRLIDLSYAAAIKLGFHHAGTAKVKVEAIDPRKWKPEKKAFSEKVYLQVGAYKDQKIAKKQYQKLYSKYNYPLTLKSFPDKYHRLYVGPVDYYRIDDITKKLKKGGYPKPIPVNKI